MQFQSIVLLTSFLWCVSCNPSVNSANNSQASKKIEEKKDPDNSAEKNDPTKKKAAGDPAVDPETKDPTDEKVDGNDNDLSAILGEWEMRDDKGSLLITNWISSKEFGLATSIKPRQNFEMLDLNKKDGIYYSIHRQEIMNRSQDQYCAHKLVKENAKILRMVICEHDSFPKSIDWTQFSNENRYSKVD